MCVCICVCVYVCVILSAYMSRGINMQRLQTHTYTHTISPLFAQRHDGRHGHGEEETGHCVCASECVCVCVCECVCKTTNVITFYSCVHLTHQQSHTYSNTLHHIYSRTVEDRSGLYDRLHLFGLEVLDLCGWSSVVGSVVGSVVDHTRTHTHTHTL
jgi:hypothetical protein